MIPSYMILHGKKSTVIAIGPTMIRTNPCDGSILMGLMLGGFWSMLYTCLANYTKQLLKRE